MGPMKSFFNSKKVGNSRDTVPVAGGMLGGGGPQDVDSAFGTNYCHIYNNFNIFNFVEQ